MNGPRIEFDVSLRATQLSRSTVRPAGALLFGDRGPVQAPRRPVWLLGPPGPPGCHGKEGLQEWTTAPLGCRLGGFAIAKRKAPQSRVPQTAARLGGVESVAPPPSHLLPHKPLLEI